VIAADDDRQDAFMHDALDPPCETYAYPANGFQCIGAMCRGRPQDIGPARAKSACAQPRRKIGRAQHVGAGFASGIARAAAGSDADELNGSQLMWQR
jgi:hypothetical protein